MPPGPALKPCRVEVLRAIGLRHFDVVGFVEDRADSPVAAIVGKRIIDLAGATVGLALLVILWPVIALAIWLDSGRPVLFRQERIGQRDRVFRLVKFRTMVRGAEAEGIAQWAAPDDPRVPSAFWSDPGRPRRSARPPAG